MSTVLDDAPASPGPIGPRRDVGDLVRTLVRGIGQTMITAGLVILLYVVYQVWVTDWFSQRAQHRVHEALQEEWRTSLPGGTQARATGEGIANLYIPRLGPDYAYTIVQGTDDASLEKGPGRYTFPGNAQPGEVGNFAVAGHRVGKGSPFLNLDQLRPGDAVVVETFDKWFVYRVKGDPVKRDVKAVDADGVPGREIVSPSDSRVLLPVPDHPGQQPTEALMTFTTCHPKYTADQRMIVYSALERSIAHDGNRLPRELLGGVL